MHAHPCVLTDACQMWRHESGWWNISPPLPPCPPPCPPQNWFTCQTHWALCTLWFLLFFIGGNNHKVLSFSLFKCGEKKTPVSLDKMDVQHLFFSSAGSQKRKLPLHVEQIGGRKRCWSIVLSKSLVFKSRVPLIHVSVRVFSHF